MPTLTERLPANVAGRFYVDASCIDCDACRTHAPDFFARNAESGYSMVVRQPVTPEEIALVEEAVNDCPTNSIGGDGG